MSLVPTNPTASSRASLSFSWSKVGCKGKGTPLSRQQDRAGHWFWNALTTFIVTFSDFDVSHYSIKTLNTAARNFQFIKKQPINMLNSKLNVLIIYPLHKPIFELMELQWAFAPQKTRSCSAARYHRYLLRAQETKRHSTSEFHAMLSKEKNLVSTVSSNPFP